MKWKGIEWNAQHIMEWMLGNEIQWNDGKVCHEHLVAAARATARAAAASSSFLRFFSSANSFSAAARASCSAFRRFSSCPTVCLSFCFACTALWSLNTQTRVCINTGTVPRLLCTFLSSKLKVGCLTCFAVVRSPVAAVRAQSVCCVQSCLVSPADCADPVQSVC